LRLRRSSTERSTGVSDRPFTSGSSPAITRRPRVDAEVARASADVGVEALWVGLCQCDACSSPALFDRNLPQRCVADVEPVVVDEVGDVVDSGSLQTAVLTD
jgi:hypothetical protein